MTTKTTKPTSLIAIAEARGWAVGRAFDGLPRVICLRGELVSVNGQLAFRCRLPNETSRQVAGFPFTTATKSRDESMTITFPADRLEEIIPVIQPKKG